MTVKQQGGRKTGCDIAEIVALSTYRLKSWAICLNSSSGRQMFLSHWPPCGFA